MERSNRKILVGKVVSTKTSKTISVEVERAVKHPLYGKRYKQKNQKSILKSVVKKTKIVKEGK